MKSKISFFNKTIFMKNVTLYWPIWGIYTLVCVILQPVLLWIFNNMDYYNLSGGGYTDAKQFTDLMDRLWFEYYIPVIGWAALITGIALFSYLYNHKTANMIHSLPVDRTQLFGTTMISGWAFLVVPLFVTAVLSSILCLVYTIPGVGFVWIWFLATAALAVIAFSIVTFCALFTGHIVVLPIYAIGINYISWGVYYLIYLVVTTFGYGVSNLGDKAQAIAMMFCPLQCFDNSLIWRYERSELGEIINVQLEGERLIALYLVIAVVLYVSAYIIYRKRKIEHAGDFLTVNWVKPIFRAAVGIVGAVFGAMVVREVLLETKIGCSVAMFVAFMIVIGVICYFAASMFISKSFHVFKKKNWMNCGIFVVVLLVFFLGLYGVAEKYETYIPKLSDVEKADIHMGYEISVEGEEAAFVIEIHEMIMEHLDEIESMIESGNRDHNSIRIDYQLKSGEYVTRRYQIPNSIEALEPVVKKVRNLEEDPENFLKYLFCEEYEDIKVFEEARFEAMFIEREKVQDMDAYREESWYNSIEIDASNAKILFDAVIADAKAGTLMKYNVNQYMYGDYAEEIYFKSSETSLMISYFHPASVATYGEDVVDVVDKDSYYNEGYTNAHLSIGPDCENIINALIQVGVISSVEDVYWGDAEDLIK